MALLSANTLLAAYDENVIRENLSDNRVKVVGDLGGNSYLQEILLQASAEVLSAAEIGERYSQTELEAMAADSSSAGGALLRRLCSDIAFAMIMARRGRSVADVSRLCPRYGPALVMLEQLRMGNRVFPGAAAAEAAGLPTLGNRDGTNLNSPRLFTQQAHRVFPNRCDGGY